jgi:hypothetical protein
MKIDHRAVPSTEEDGSLRVRKRQRERGRRKEKGSGRQERAGEKDKVVEEMRRI